MYADKQSFQLFSASAMWAWSGMSSVPKITSLKYLCNISRKARDKCDFLFEEKHQSFLQVGSMVFTGQS